VESIKNDDTTPQTAAPKVGWRVKTGFTLLIASIVWPVLLPILPLFGLSGQAVAKVTGVMFVAAEVLMLSAAAIAGKDGYAYIKQRVFGFIKSYGPPQTVGAGRYKTGLVIFVLPLLYAFLSPYIRKYIPGLAEHEMVLAIAGDGMLLVGLFLLGGDFWEKLRALFIHQAVAVIPDQSAK
jgi:hypothetical protein